MLIKSGIALDTVSTQTGKVPNGRNYFRTAFLFSLCVQPNLALVWKTQANFSYLKIAPEERTKLKLVHVIADVN